MKSLKFLSLLLFLALCNMQAQEVKSSVAWSDEFKLPFQHDPWDIVGNTTDGFIQLSYLRGRNVCLHKFSANMKLEKQVDIATQSQNWIIEKVKEVGGKYYLFYRMIDKKAKTVSLISREIDIKNVKLGAAKQLAKCNLDDVKFNFVLAKEMFYIVGRYPLEGSSKKFIPTFDFWCYDNSLNQVWNKQAVKMPYVDMAIYNKSFGGDSKGNLYALTQVFEKTHPLVQVEWVFSKLNYKYEIYKYSKTENGVMIPVDMEEKSGYISLLEEGSDGEMVFTGIYTDKNAEGGFFREVRRYDGAYIFKIDATANKLNKIGKGFFPVNNKIFKLYEHPKGEEKESCLNGSCMYLQRFIANPDKSYSIVIEKSYSDNAEQAATYFYQDVYIHNISADGTKEWVSKVPKRQIGRPIGLSVGTTTKGNKLDVLFLDHIKNLDIKEGGYCEIHNGGWGGVLMAVQVDENGKTTKGKVFDTREVDYRIDVDKITDLGNGLIVARTQFGTSPNAHDAAPYKLCLIKIE